MRPSSRFSHGREFNLCRRCREVQPTCEFLRASTPGAQAVRHWCGECLVTRGHARKSELDRARADRAALLHARTQAVIDADAARIVQQAARDPHYSEAVIRAAMLLVAVGDPQAEQVAA